MNKKSYLRYMETNKKIAEEVQGTETAKVTEVNETGTERKQKVSVTYTLRAFGENVKKMYELELLTREEAEQGLKLVASARNKYLGGEITLD